MNDPLKRAKQSLDKACEGLDNSRSSMGVYESKVKETLNKFEESFGSLRNEIAKNTNDMYVNLKEILAVAIENTNEIASSSSSIDERISEIVGTISAIKDENQTDTQSIINKVQGSYGQLVEVIKDIDDKTNDVLYNIKNYSDVFSSFGTKNSQDIKEVKEMIRNAEISDNNFISEIKNSFGEVTTNDSKIIGALDDHKASMQSALWDLSILKQMGVNLTGLCKNIDTRTDEIVEFIKLINDFCTKTFIDNYETLLEEVSAVNENIDQNTEQITEMSKETSRYKDSFIALQEKYEQSTKEVNVLKNMVKKSTYLSIGFGVVNLVLVIVILFSVLK